MSPMLTREILWYKVIICTVPIILVILICSAANIFNSSYHIQMTFFRNTDRLLRVLKENRLSEPLLMETEKYFNVIWALTKGENIPKMLQVTPRYLKQSLMATIYGRHLESHFLFADTHVDFLRQIVTRISRYIFLTNHEIVAQGESDGCMYFVHSGEVQCRQVLLSGEEFAYILPKGSAFGEGPGLFNVPHSATYYSKTVSDIIILHRDNWRYLLFWFPASREKIMQKAREYRVLGANNKKNIEAFLNITSDVYY